MQKIYGIIGILLVATVVYFLSRSSFKGETGSKSASPAGEGINRVAPNEASINLRAGFAIFTNATFRVFTGAMYHDRSKDVYIEERNPNIVRVKKKGTTWNDFFTTLPFKLSKDCLTTGTQQTFCNSKTRSLKFYLNGVGDDDLLHKEIKNGDKALVTYGPINEDVKNQLEQIPNPIGSG